MKRHQLLAAISGLLLSGLAYAAPFSIDELQEATRIAVKDFTAANPSHATHLTGFKSWFSGDDARVKIYVSHQGMNMDFNFSCHKHDDEIECHAQ